MNNLEQDALFGGVEHAAAKPLGKEARHQRVLITVKAAPNPSAHHGETVCVAGIRLDDYGTKDWVRLYPINFRDLDGEHQFRKYSLVTVACRPAEQDQRRESWKPNIATMKVGEVLASGTRKRRDIVEPLATDTMCGLYNAARADNKARSLGLARPAIVTDFEVEPHPGWTSDEQAKIDAYVSQPELFNDKRKTPLEAPKYRGFYRWKCRENGCKGHRSMNLDWEFVAHQRTLAREGHSPAETIGLLKRRWLEEMCAVDRFTAFYLGNQAKRAHTFSVLGVYWPKLALHS